jgi:hypothetical protein
MSPIGLPSEVYGILIEFGVIRTSYTLHRYKLSKVGTLQSRPIEKPPYIGVEGGGGGFKTAIIDTQHP